MIELLSKLRFTIQIAFSLILCSCTVAKQGMVYQIGFDQNELTSSTVQEFRLGKSKSVLRKNQNNEYQIKLYDRMKVIDMGKLQNAQVMGTYHLGDHDLIVVNTPTTSCRYIYRVYEINGYDVGMWEINNMPGDCNFPLEFSTDKQTWLARSNQPDHHKWTWANGKLFSGIDLSSNYNRAVSNSNVSNSVVSIGSTKSNNPQLIGHFESGGTSNKDTSANNNRLRIRKTKHFANTFKPASNTSHTFASSKTPKRIDPGKYETQSDNGQSEMMPVIINLRDIK